MQNESENVTGEINPVAPTSNENSFNFEQAFYDVQAERNELAKQRDALLVYLIDANNIVSGCVSSRSLPQLLKEAVQYGKAAKEQA